MHTITFEEYMASNKNSNLATAIKQAERIAGATNEQMLLLSRFLWDKLEFSLTGRVVHLDQNRG